MADNSSNATTQVVNTDSPDTSRLDVLKARLEIAKTWCKKPQKSWKKWISEYEIEDIADTNEVRDKVRIGYIFRRTESDLPAIFDDQPDLFIKGKGDTKILDPLIQGTYDWLWNVQNLDESIENAATYFLLLGMGFITSPWLTKNKTITQTEQQPVLDEKGQPVIDENGQPTTQEQEVPYEVPIINRPDAIAENPFNIYFSPETKFNPIMDYEHCPYYFKKYVMSKEEVKARWGKNVDADESLHIDGDEDTNDVIDKLKDNNQKEDIKRVTVYEYYGCLPKAQAKGIKDKDGKAVSWEYDKDYHIWMTKKEELDAEECPYEQKPIFIIGNYGLANKFFKFGDAKHLMPLVQELQIYRSQNLRHVRRVANPKALIPADAEFDEKNFKDPREGTIVKYTPGVTGAKPEYMLPPRLGQEVENGIGQVRTDLEKTSGSFDLATGGSSSTVKTPRGIQVFSDASDKNVARKKKKVARLIRQIIIFQFKQLGMFWTPDGTEEIEVVSDNESQKVPVVKEVLQVFNDYNILAKIDIEVESLSVNRVQQKQDAMDLFDLASKFPYIFNLDQMAKDLLQNGFGKKDSDRYLATDQQKQQYYDLMKVNRSNIRANIQIDGADPIGAQMLENEGFLQPGQGQQLSQVAEQAQTKQEAAKTVSYTDLPPSGQIQKAGQADIQLTPEDIAQKDALSTHQKNAQTPLPQPKVIQGNNNNVRR